MSKFFAHILKDGTKRMINLKHVSRIELSHNYPKQISFYMSHEKHKIIGSAMFIIGCDNITCDISFETENEAITNYNKIIEFIKSDNKINE